MKLRALLVTGALAALTACSSGASGSGPQAERLVVVSAPLSTSPWIGTFTRRGAELAAKELGDVRVEVLDNRGSPSQAAADAREAVRR